MTPLDKADGVIIETVSQAIVDALVEHAWVGSEIVSEGSGIIRMNTCRVNVEAIAQALSAAGLLAPAVGREGLTAEEVAAVCQLRRWMQDGIDSVDLIDVRHSLKAILAILSRTGEARHD